MVLITSSGPETLPIGSPAPDFHLPDVDGKTHSLASLSTGPLLVLNFTCNHCPYAQAYEDRFMALVREFGPVGISFAAINPNDATSYPDDSLANMKKRATARGFNFPYLCDDSQVVARDYGAVCTPHLFVVARGTIAYEGRIDDSWKDPAAAKAHDLRDALVALLAGNPPPRPRTPPMGCSIKWKK
jgi:peroxiredoxin